MAFGVALANSYNTIKLEQNLSMKNSKHGGLFRLMTWFKTHLWHHRSIPQRVLIIFLFIAAVIYIQGILIASWYINKHKNEPLNFGVTFSTEYANYLGVEPQATFKALRDEMGFKRFRLMTFWNMVEPQKGVYDFSDIDWQLKMIQEVGGTATVAIGLRQPRWPECHEPQWAKGEPTAQLNSEIKTFLAKTIEHLKSSKVITSYQLENEYFLSVFGNCKNQASRQQLTNEYNLVKKLDPSRPIIMSLANNYFGIPIGQPRPDQFAVSVYKRVFDYTVTHRYLEYPFTPKYYAYRAGLTEMFTKKSSMLHELQVEPWIPPKFNGVINAPISEQNKSMDSKRAALYIHYGVDTGFRDIDLWGGEWWYWRKTKLHDPGIWNSVKDALADARAKDSSK